MDRLKFVTVSSDNLFNTRMNIVIWIIGISYEEARCTFATRRRRRKQKKHLHISYCQFLHGVGTLFLVLALLYV